MTWSPTATDSSPRLPLSSNLPGPTASTLPRCGFSLAESGSTMPPAVRSSASTGSTTTRSSSGRIRKLAMNQIPYEYVLYLRFSLRGSGLVTRCLGGSALPVFCVVFFATGEAGASRAVRSQAGAWERETGCEARPPELHHSHAAHTTHSSHAAAHSAHAVVMV